MTPITYPARPVNGGALDLAPPKDGHWHYEPKYNGWRALIHTPTRTMFNRLGAPLTIAAEFQPALTALMRAPFEWIDAEALERRHGIGRGSLVVLDAVTHGTYLQRRQWLEAFFKPDLGPLFIDPDRIYLTPSLDTATPIDLLACWAALQERNRILGCDFYEGFVAKRADSLYPIQLRNPNLPFPYWIKHRFL